MGRLADHLKRAAIARDGLEHAVGLDVSKYVERVGQIHKRREDVFLRKHGELDLAVTDLSEFERDLEDFAKNDRSGDGGSAYVGTTETAVKKT